MKKSLYFLCVAFAMCSLGGCNKAVLQSMGSGVMPVYHEPARMDSVPSAWTVSADVLGVPFGQGQNVESVQTLGGDVSLLHRFAGTLNPLFLQLDFAGQLGKTEFTCNQGNCWDAYEAWLVSADGSRKQFFWFVQERILAGADFQLSRFFQLGWGVGIQLHQAGGEYEDMRFELEKQRLARNIDGKRDWHPVAGLWLGFSLPSPEKFGVVKWESDFLIASKISEGSTTTDLSYYHPSGFHGGISLNSQWGLILHFGKSFEF